MLADEESYVYLAAVQGLSVLATNLPAMVLPLLVEKFTGKETTIKKEAGQKEPMRSTSSEMSWAQRVKVGEALMCAARKCGASISKYSQYFMRAFILGARMRSADVGDDSDWVNFRSSCLSNLAEVCGLLKWSLDRYAQDIFDLALGILQMEGTNSQEALAARRGSLYIMYKILNSLDSTNFAGIIGSHIKSMYRRLKIVAKSDCDSLCKHNAQMCIDVIDVFMRGLFLAQHHQQQSLEVLGGVGSGFVPPLSTQSSASMLSEMSPSLANEIRNIAKPSTNKAKITEL